MKHVTQNNQGGGVKIRGALVGCLLLILLVAPGILSVSLPFALYSNAQTSFQNIVSFRVSGTPNYSSPGGESFWNSIAWTNVPLAASVSPGGGHTPNLLVKSANDGYNVYMLFKWNVTEGPSFLSENELYRAANGTLLPLTPGVTTNVTQLFYNSTYYYPDRIAMLWFIENQTQMKQSPVMALGSDGAITGGAAEIWHWQANPTDNSLNDTGFPGGYTDPSGQPVFPADNLSFAEDDYTNTTGFFVIGGCFGINASNLVQYADPFIVHAGSYYSNSNKTWTVEMVRSFTTAQATNYRVQLKDGSSYFIALAVWQGRMGESADFKSVSQWYNITISSLPPPVTQTTTTANGGVTVPLAAMVAIGALIVGIAIGTIIRSSPKK